MLKLALLDPTRTGSQARNLEEELRHLIVGQEEAINQIVRTYQTHLAGLSPIGRPVGNFLFLGPTGSGKTRIVEATAESLLDNPRELAHRVAASARQSALTSASPIRANEIVRPHEIPYWFAIDPS